MSPLHHDAKLQTLTKSAATSTPRPAARPKKSKKHRPSKDPTTGLRVKNPNAGAIDVGGAEHWAAIPADRGGLTARSFGCCTAELRALAQWLQKHRVDTVVMEATGNYWVALYEILEEHGLEVVLVNARYAKNMSGKKGDLLDCQWMQKLHTFGLFANSFRPTEPIRVLRTYLRQREELVASSARAIQHLQKALVEMNIQLANVISDISGETGLRILDAILAGQRDPQQLAGLKDPRIRASISQLARHLEGHWKDEQLFVLEQARQTYTHYQEQLAVCEDQIREHLQSLQSRLPQAGSPQPAPACAEPMDSKAAAEVSDKPWNLGAELRRIAGVDLTQIDGIGPVTAQVLLSEIGVDISPWPTEKHFASWLGLCPDHRISGGKILSRHTRPVVNRARNALRMAAYTLERSQSWLGAKYRRLKRRLGAPKAITAMAHHLARLIWQLLRHGHDYVDKGMEAYEARWRQQQRQWLEKKAREMNLTLVAIQPLNP